MKQDKHLAEVYCDNVFRQYPNLREGLKRLEHMRGGKYWPDWCPLPMTATYALLTNFANVSKAPAMLKQLAANALQTATAAIAWMTESKIIYRFDDTLRAELAAQSLTGELPPEILRRLPYRCVFIEDEREIDGLKSLGFFAWNEFDVNHRWQELRLLYLANDGATLSVPIPLVNGAGIAKALDIIADEEMKKIHKSKDGLSADIIKSMFLDSVMAFLDSIMASVNMLLYLCSEAPDIPQAQEVLTRRSKARDGAPKRAATLDVGYRIGAALRSSVRYMRDDDAPHPDGKTGRRNAPHIRRAHWHTYRVGKRDAQTTILKWLPPIPVNIDEISKILPTVVPVKE